MKEEDKKKIIETKKIRYKALADVSEKISNGTRNLSIAGVSASWVLINFGLSQSLGTYLMEDAIISIYFFASAILGEFLHLLIEWFVRLLYSTETCCLFRIKDGEVKINKIPSFSIWLAWIIWGAKIICMFLGYWYLFSIIRVIQVLG